MKKIFLLLSFLCSSLAAADWVYVPNNIVWPTSAQPTCGATLGCIFFDGTNFMVSEAGGAYVELGTGASGGMAIGGTVTGGTATRMLFVAAGPVLSDDAGFTYNAATDSATLVGSTIAGGFTLTGGTATRVLFLGASGVFSEDAGFVYNAATDSATLVGSAVAGGFTLTGGTATRVLFLGASGVFSEDAGFVYDSGTDTATLVGPMVAGGFTLTGGTATRVLFLGASGVLSTDAELTFDSTGNVITTTGVSLANVVIADSAATASSSATYKIASISTTDNNFSYETVPSVSIDGLPYAPIGNDLPSISGRWMRTDYITNMTATAFTAVGWDAPTVVGTPAANQNFDHMTINYTSGLTLADLGGIEGPFTSTRFKYKVRYGAIVQPSLGTVATFDRRYWVGLAEAAISGLSCVAGPTASTVDFIGVCFQGQTSSNYFCCSGDGTNYSCTDTGVVPSTPGDDADTYIVLDYTAVNSTLACWINGTLTTKTSNLPGDNISVGRVAVGRNSTGGAGSASVQRVVIQWLEAQ